MPTLEQRVQRLEDESAIKALKARYCEHCDNAYDPDGIASSFIAEGVWDGGFMGRFADLDQQGYCIVEGLLPDAPSGKKSCSDSPPGRLTATKVRRPSSSGTSNRRRSNLG